MQKTNLTLEKLQIKYDDRLIVRAIQAELKPGDFIALVGENGSGKSSLLKKMLKINPIAKGQGDIYYASKSIKKYRPSEWAGIVAAVLSKPATVPHVRVKEILTLFSGALYPSDHKESLLESVVQSTRLASLMGQYVDELSDGQLQRVLIARALYQHTPFILCDEPTVYLDYSTKRRVFQLLRSLAKDQGKGVLIATHELEAIFPLVDCVWWIKEGVLHKLEPSEELLCQILG